MTVTPDQLREEVGAPPSVSDDRLAQFIALADALVTQYVGDVVVPPVVLDEATLATAAEAWHIRKAPNGVLSQQYDLGSGDSSSIPVRIGRDALKAAYPLLEQWVSGKFFCA